MRWVCLIAGFMLALPGLAQQAATREAVMLTEPGLHSDRAIASIRAFALVDEVNRARAAIKIGDRATAVNETGSAIDAAKDLASEGHTSGAVPIYVELAQRFEKGPVGAERRESSTSNDHLQFGAVDQPVTNITTMMQYTTMSLNVDGLIQKLETARAALNAGKLNAADRSLASVQDAVTIQTVAEDLPLLRARQNLNLAAEQARSGEYLTAQTTLRAAAGELRKSRGGEDAQRLAAEIEACANSLPADHANAVSKISGFWNRAADLSRPPAP